MNLNNPDVNPSTTSTQKLNLGLFYFTVPTGLSGNIQYNGNIAAMVWNTPEKQSRATASPTTGSTS